MNEKMFCFQCEQTAGCGGCTGSAGACGKSAEAAREQDRLTGALMGLARLVQAGAAAREETWPVLLGGLFATVTNVDFDPETVRAHIRRTHEEAQRIAPGRAAEDYDVSEIWEDQEDIRSLKSLVLFGLRGMAAYAHHALALGYTDRALNAFFLRALAQLTRPGDMDTLAALALETGKYNLTCMELLDRAHTETYGVPAPKTVPLTVEKGPFIVVTGHDLHDLKLLLEQTEGRGVNVYTHGEMLPAHGYPELKRYPHLKGHFGTAWQNQQREFAALPAPILFTTNCLMPPKDSYAHRVFTTSVVSFPGVAHIGPEKDFSPVIRQALDLGGFDRDTPFTGINGGGSVTTGYGHGAVLASAGAIVEAVRSGAIRHFFLVGGCDGARPGRNYYTEFVRQTPPDTLVLTLACGKFRFNDLDLGTVAGLPRLLDVGQCNDAYGAIRIALALADAFGCGVNDLPLSLVLSWYEQKAVCILLTLLHLGLKHIRLGPTLPAFLSPNVARYLTDQFQLAPITTPEADLSALLPA